MANSNRRVDRRSSRWEKHRAQRRLSLINLTIHAVRSYGRDVSMDEIAAIAETSKSIIYRYFVDKDGLQLEVRKHFIEELSKRMHKAAMPGKTAQEKTNAMISEYLRTLEEDEELYFFVLSASRNRTPDAAELLNMDGIAIELVQLYAKELGIPTEQMELDPVRVRLVTVAIIALVRGIGENWISTRELIDDPKGFPGQDIDEILTGVANLGRAEMTAYIGDLVRQPLLHMVEFVLGLDRYPQAVVPGSEALREGLEESA